MVAFMRSISDNKVSIRGKEKENALHRVFFFELVCMSVCTSLAFTVRGSYRSQLISDDTRDFAHCEGSNLFSNDLADGTAQFLVVSAIH